MEELISVAKITGVSETLLIPLVGRAMAGRLFPELGFSDPAAAAVLSKLNFDPARLAGSKEVVKGAAIRVMIFDGMAREFFAGRPDALGVSLGAGFGTRFQRIDNGRLRWADIDLPEVIEAKKKVLAETERYRMLGQSAFDASWLQKIGRRAAEPILIVSEGVFLYFDAGQVKQLIDRIIDACPVGVELSFDYCHPILTRNSRELTEVKGKEAGFKWAVKNPKDLLQWNRRLMLLGTEPITERLGGVTGAMAKLFRWLTGTHVYGVARFKIQPK